MATDSPAVGPAPTQQANPWRLMLLSCLTLGLYGAYAVLRDGHIVGRVVGKRRVGLGMGLLLTVITLGIFPGVYVVVLASDLQRHSQATNAVGRQPQLGPIVLAADVLSLFAAIASGGLTLLISVVLWSYGCHLVLRELALYVPRNA